MSDFIDNKLLPALNIVLQFHTGSITKGKMVELLQDLGYFDFDTQLQTQKVEFGSRLDVRGSTWLEKTMETWTALSNAMSGVSGITVSHIHQLQFFVMLNSTDDEQIQQMLNTVSTPPDNEFALPYFANIMEEVLSNILKNFSDNAVTTSTIVSLLETASHHLAALENNMDAFEKETIMDTDFYMQVSLSVS